MGILDMEMRDMLHTLKRIRMEQSTDIEWIKQIFRIWETQNERIGVAV